MPAGQARHTELEVAPTSVEYLPAIHFEHWEVPVVLVQVPGKQFVHADSAVAADWLENLPIAQSTHVVLLVAPITVEYVPGTQA